MEGMKTPNGLEVNIVDLAKGGFVIDLHRLEDDPGKQLFAQLTRYAPGTWHSSPNFGHNPDILLLINNVDRRYAEQRQHAINAERERQAQIVEVNETFAKDRLKINETFRPTSADTDVAAGSRGKRVSEKG